MGQFVLHINGEPVHVTASGEESLLFVLREHLHLTGTKYGCGEAQCGACTVLMNGQATRSCQTTIQFCEHAHITTIEGLERNGQLSPVQQAFVEEGAFQCGYCTSGMIVSATALLRDHPEPSDEQIIDAMNGNLCRCGTYPRIVAAIKRASKLANAGAEHAV